VFLDGFDTYCFTSNIFFSYMLDSGADGTSDISDYLSVISAGGFLSTNSKLIP
jgi:hypothetical protein